ncbi:MAG: hypothetical protein LLF83_04315 [Methanobacterium sp.]|nr:hypothetical protein [Methanobacterium sp.]
MTSDSENPQKSTKRGSDKENGDKGSKPSSNSFLQNLKTSLIGEHPVENQGKNNNNHRSSEITEQKESVKNISHNTQISSEKEDNKESDQKNSDEDPTIYFMNNLKDHKRIASLRKRKDTIIKVTASVISIILIIVGIIYSFGRSQDVASNVIFGERAMFAAFLILVGFMILAAVFASKLMEGRFLGKISKELNMVEGKNGKDQQKHHTDQKNQTTSKKNK